MYGNPTMALTMEPPKTQTLGCCYMLEGSYSMAMYLYGNRILDLPGGEGYLDIVGLVAVNR
jgi:hypothetical protein